MFAWCCVFGTLVARATAPSDLHDQTQPKTIAYTVDMVLHPTLEHWVLPTDRGIEKATKPPLYNWLAAPWVAMTGGRSEIAHRIPSIVAYLLLAGLLWRLGRTLEPSGLLAALSLLAFSCHYMWFKLSYLARPDGLLTLWLVLSWISATALVGDGRGAAPRLTPAARAIHRLMLWTSGAFALLTKGPPGLVIPIFVAVLGAAETPAAGLTWKDRVRGAAAALRSTGAAWGILLMLAPFGLWLWLVHQIAPDHLVQTLWRDEIANRMLGANREMAEGGPLDLLSTVVYMPLYFVTRFLPWSILPTFLAFQWLRKGPRMRWSEKIGPVATDAAYWLRSSCLWIVLIIVAFTFSASKRADYIASAFIPGALIAAFLVIRLAPQVTRLWVPASAAVAAATLLILTGHAHTLDYSARYPLTDVLHSFAREAQVQIDANPLPLAFYQIGPSPLQSLLFRSQPDDESQLLPLFAEGKSFWLVSRQPYLAELKGKWGASGDAGWTFTAVVESTPTKGSENSPPFQAVLLQLTPPVRDSLPPKP